MSELHLRTILPWNIIINALKTQLKNTNSICLPSCKCNKIFKNKKSELISKHHHYLQNQICQTEICEFDTMKYFGRGLFNKLDYPPKIHSIGINEKQLRYFFSKFLETIAEFAKTKKIDMENIEAEFVRSKNEYNNCTYIKFDIENIYNIQDIQNLIKKLNHCKKKDYKLCMEDGYLVFDSF